MVRTARRRGPVVLESCWEWLPIPPGCRSLAWHLIGSSGSSSIASALVPCLMQRDYGDTGRNTLGHIAESRPLKLPTLLRLGIGHIAPLPHLAPADLPEASFGKGATHSPGKDTTTGHWEMAGIWLPQAFPVYPDGFPPELIDEFEKRIGRAVLGNMTRFRNRNTQGTGRGAPSYGKTDCLHLR